MFVWKAIILIFAFRVCSCLRKCCGPDEYLAENYTCGVFLTNVSTSLTGLPSDCSTYESQVFNQTDMPPDEYCLDREGEGEPLMLVRCRRSTIVVRKCCGRGFEFDLIDHKCVEGNKSDQFDAFVGGAGSAVVEYGSPTCEHPRVMRQYSQRDYGLSMQSRGLMVGNLLLEHGSYCVDGSTSGSLVARSCRDGCEGRPCVTKCCPEGQIYQYDATNCTLPPECRPSELGFSFRLGGVNASSETSSPESIGIKYNQQCSKYFISPKLESLLDPDTGDLIIPSQKNPRKKNYCMETIVNVCRKKNALKKFKFVCNESKTEIPAKLHLYSIGVYVSCIFLVIILLVYLLLPQLRNVHGKIVMCQTGSLLMAFLCLARTNISMVNQGTFCTILGYMLHYSFLAEFCWLNVLCVDIWKTFGNIRSSQDACQRNDLKKFLKYSAYGWGMPAILTFIAYMIDIYDVAPGWLDPEIGTNTCWISQNDSKMPWLILFVLPVGIMIGVNFVIFLYTVIYCNKVKSKIMKMQRTNSIDGRRKKFSTDKEILSMNIKLFLVMGATWIFEIISSLFSNVDVVWYIFDAINVLQGIPIFWILIMKKNVYRLLKIRLGMIEPKATEQTESTAISSNEASRKMSTVALKKNSSIDSSKSPY